MGSLPLDGASGMKFDFRVWSSEVQDRELGTSVVQSHIVDM